MVKRERIEYLRKGLKREETLQRGLPFRLENELNKSLDDWRYKFHSHLNDTVKLFQSSYSEIEWVIIKPTVEFDDFKIETSEIPQTKQNDGSYRLKIPHSFIELDLEINWDSSRKIKWKDTQLDAELLELDRTRGFHKSDNLNTKTKQLIVREQVIQILKEAWEIYKLPGATIQITHKRVHFVDSSVGLVEKAVLNILSQILDIEPNKIKNSIEEKFKSFTYYYKCMKFKFIDIYEDVPNIRRSGDKLIYKNEHRDLASRFAKRLNYEDSITSNIQKALLTDGRKESVIMQAPKFNDALVFRDNKENIEAIFHICFETNVIQNEKRIFMNTNNLQMKKLMAAIKSSR